VPRCGQRLSRIRVTAEVTSALVPNASFTSAGIANYTFTTINRLWRSKFLRERRRLRRRALLFLHAYGPGREPHSRVHLPCEASVDQRCPATTRINQHSCLKPARIPGKACPAARVQLPVPKCG